jgi:hypothetical protein
MRAAVLMRVRKTATASTVRRGRSPPSTTHMPPNWWQRCKRTRRQVATPPVARTTSAITQHNAGPVAILGMMAGLTAPETAGGVWPDARDMAVAETVEAEPH